MENANGVILLIYGIPAAGKTKLVTGLCEGSQTQRSGTFVCVHFDDFYPPDFRGCTDEHQKTDSCSEQPLFKLKHARQDLNNNLNHLILVNRLGTAGNSSVSDGCDSWGKFLSVISSSNPHVSFDHHGRIQGSRHPVVILLDDNMIYHSIRHEYYQIARKCNRFGEVLVQCPFQLAMSRNDKRQIPIPSQTIKYMADELEPAQPDKFNWEHNSITIDSQMTDDAWPVVWSLVQTACNKPAQPVVDDSERVLLDRQHTQESIIHQADQVLRKCVTNKISTFKGTPELPTVAKSANAVKRELLELIRSKQLLLPLSSSCQQLAMDINFVSSIERHFTEMYDFNK
ncbi:L-seryl-tRNA(Sec) kinase-like isoform X2 [Dysidea avara]|uniref:L-seryl-tRNA(Sec) kinase-like isoform X2 n=1 Tax=Dysidea avara TaxID=196820 RepID=UPI00332BAEBF